MDSNSDDNQDPSQPPSDAPEPNHDAPESHRKGSARGKVEKRIKSLMDTLQNLASNEKANSESEEDVGAESGKLHFEPDKEHITEPTDMPSEIEAPRRAGDDQNIFGELSDVPPADVNEPEAEPDVEPISEQSDMPAEDKRADAESEEEITKPLRKMPVEMDEAHKLPEEEAGTEQAEPVESPTQPEGAPELSSSEEALAEVRRSLIEDQTQEKTGFRASLSRLGQRLFRRKPKSPEELPEDSSRLDEYRIPETPAPRKTFVPPDSLAEHLDDKPAVQDQEEVPAEPTGPAERHEEPARREMFPTMEPPKEEEPEPVAPSHSILATLRQDEPEQVEEEPSKIREAALEDYVTEPEEEEEGRSTPLRRLRRSWRDMRPLERRMLVVALMIIALAVVAGSGYLAYISVPKPTPAPTPTLSTLPVPITVSLPGSLVFPLRTGFVQSDGTWNPTGPEWLQGTEICRWVSLPWSVQLEAVLRTLKADDEIRLTMSNYDTLTFKVKSIEQVPTDQISKLAPTTPSLLVILSKQDSPTRWVVTAKP